MFRIIGGDSRQYGPVTADEVREWIKLGRAGAQTQAQRDGETEWKSLSAFPEFSEAFAGSTLSEPGGTSSASAPGALPALPIVVQPDADRLADDAIARADGVDMGWAFGRSWDLLTADFWPIVGITALVSLIIAAANGAIIGPLVSGPLLGGLNWYLLKKLRGEPAQMSDAFAGFTGSFLQLFLGFLVSTLLIGVGLALCLIPGIYLAVAWQFTLLLILDHKLEFWPAMEVSRKVISKNWWGFFGFAIVCWLLNLVGVLCCLVGAFVTLPWTMLALVCLYESRFGRAPASAAPAVPNISPA